MGRRIRPSAHACGRRACRHRRHDRQGSPHQPRSQADARQHPGHSGQGRWQRSVRPAGRAVGAVRPGQGRRHLRSEPPARRHLRAGELLRPLRPPAGARHEAPGGAGKPSRRDHRGAERHRQAVFRRSEDHDLPPVGPAFRRPLLPVGGRNLRRSLPAPAAAHRSPRHHAGKRRIRIAVRFPR